MPERVITTYLQDHHAGSSAGVDAFHRVAECHGDAEVAKAVCRLATQIHEDQSSLKEFMDLVGAKQSIVKSTASKIGEKVARLKPNERVTKRSPLSDVIELEMLVMAVHANGLMWRGLLALDDERIDPERLKTLAERADARYGELKKLRISEISKLHHE